MPLANANREQQPLAAASRYPIRWTKAYGWTTAVDPATGRRKVAYQDGDADDRGSSRRLPAVCSSPGDLNGNFLALDATTGKILYGYDTKGAVAGGVITYSAGGTQYVAAASGNTSFVAWKVTGKPTLVVFGL